MNDTPGNDASPVRRSRVPATHLGRYRHHYLLGAVAIAAWLLLPALLRMPGAPDSPLVVAGGALPLTTAPGLERQPRFVPESDWIVYAVMHGARGDWNLERVSLADGTTLPVAVSPGVHEHGPAVSPAGDQVAYVRIEANRCEVVVQALDGGAARPVAACTSRLPTLVDWSPSGTHLAFTTDERNDPDSRRRIYLAAVAGGDVRRLSDATTPTGSDLYPRYSPSGRRLAFLRTAPQPDEQSTLWMVDVATGEERRLPAAPAEHGGMTWIDEDRLLYSTLDAGRLQAGLVDVRTGATRPVEPGDLLDPEYRPADGTLVAAAPRRDRDLALIGTDRDATIAVSSTGDVRCGRLAPDEKRIAFVARQGGGDDIMVAAADGQDVWRLARADDGTVSCPDWHPDGGRLLYAAHGDTAGKLYVADTGSAAISEIDTGFDDIRMPRWIEDGWVAECRDGLGRGICFGNPAGTRRIANGYYRPAPAGVGNVYVVDDAGGLFNLALADGSATKILGGMPGGGRYGWEVDDGTLYFLAAGDGGDTGRLMTVDLGGGEPQTIYSGAMPVADTTISVGRISGNVLLALYRSPGDDLVFYRRVAFPQRSP